MPTPDPHIRSGRDALKAGRAKRAISYFSKAITIDPKSTAAAEGLARAFHADGQTIPALQVLDHLITSNRATTPTWVLTTEILIAIGEAAQSLAACQRGLQDDPQSAELHHNLGMSAYALGEADLAAKHLAQADLLHAGIQSLSSRAILLPGAPSASQEEILATRRALANRLAGLSALADQPRPGPYRNPRPRIGYLSAHFHNENYMKPVWALLNNHDREQFDLHLFSDSIKKQASFPGYRKDPGDRIHTVGSLDSRRLAKLITKEQIDLLVDLSNYSTTDRFDLFLSPVAPVVATWFNAFATSGLPGIDIIIGDDESVRPGEETCYSERVVRLPLSYLTFEVTHSTPPVVDPPCLKNGFLTFGSLVTQYKITPPVLDTWSELLCKAPNTRLFLANKTLSSKENRNWLLARFAERGVDAERLTILPPAPHLEFLSYYDGIDIALDAFPYNGGTTTMEAIWQGVPVLTFDGDRWASRTSQSILRRTHLSEFVSPSREKMLAHALQLATDPDTPRVLATLRSQMRDRLATSSACDGPALTRAMETLYTELLAS